MILEPIAGAELPIARVRATAHPFDFDLPWLRVAHERSGIAVAVAAHRWITRAAVLADVDDPRIVAIDHDRDLALIEMEEAHPAPAPVGELPAVGQMLVVAGTQAAATGSALVRGVGLARYPHSQRHLLSLQLDGRQPLGADALFRSRQLVGLVMSADDDHQGEAIPAPLLRAFLAGARGVPALGIAIQPLANPALRAQLGLGPRDGGVMVTHVDVAGTCDGAVRVRDVLLAIDGVPVGEDGCVDHLGAHLRHYAVLGTRAPGEPARLSLRRAGAALAVDVTLRPWLPLVPRARHAAYLVFAGLVFQPLTRDYLTTWEAWWDKAPKPLLHAYYDGHRTRDRDELVVLAQVFDDPINAGYAPLVNETVLRVGDDTGDRVPRDLADLARMLDAADGAVQIELSSGAVLGFDAAAARARAPAILAAHRIPRDRSF